VVIARAQMHAAARLESNGPVAIQLQLIGPACQIVRQVLGAKQQHRRHETGFDPRGHASNLQRFRPRAPRQVGAGSTRAARSARARWQGAYCPEGLRVAVRPIDSPLTTNSTRRFCWRPAGVALLATGRLSPNPSASTEVAAIFWCTRYVRTDSARRSDNCWL